MDQPTEPPAPFTDHMVKGSLEVRSKAHRPWVLPMPLKAQFTGLSGAGVQYPGTPASGLLKARVHVLPSVLLFPGSSGGFKHWLVLSAAEDPDTAAQAQFEFEQGPYHRVDGPLCKGILHGSRHGLHMIDADLPASTLSSLATRILELDSGSRILVRLSPRQMPVQLRTFKDSSLIQLWCPV